MTNVPDEFITSRSGKPHRWSALAATWLLAAALNPLAPVLAQQAPNGSGTSQAAPAQPAQPGQPTPGATAQPRGLFPAQPPPAQQPSGFIYAFGRWWDNGHGKSEDLTKQPSDAGKAAAEASPSAPADAKQSTTQVPGGVATTTQDALKDAAQATKDAASALFRLPNLRMVEVHQRCSIAPNGAPDCRVAATTACRAKGFSDGHPIDVRSSENCPPAVWMSGREPAPGQCPEETVILMVACQ